MKKVSLVLFALALLAPSFPVLNATSGQYWPKGYIEKVDFLKMEILVDGEAVSISPNTKVTLFNRKHASIIDLDKGMFASISAMKKGDQVSAIRIDSVSPKMLKTLTGTVVSVENEYIVLDNGLKIQLENGAKLVGMASVRLDAVVKVKGFTERQVMKVWRVEPLFPDSMSFEITAKLTSITRSFIKVDGNIKITRGENEHFLDESGKVITESDIPVGRIVKILCSSSEGFITSINTQRFSRVAIKIEQDSNIAKINEKEFRLKYPVVADSAGVFIPCRELLSYCGVKLGFSKDKSVMYANFDGSVTVCNFKTNEAIRDGITFSFPKVSQKYEDETIVSIYTFALCMGGKPPFVFPINSRTHIVFRD